MVEEVGESAVDVAELLSRPGLGGKDDWIIVEEPTISPESVSGSMESEGIMAEFEGCRMELGLEIPDIRAPELVAETKGDSDLLLTREVKLLMMLSMDEGKPCTELFVAPKLLDGTSTDERTRIVLGCNELGIDRVTGSAVESTEVVGGGGAKVVPWSVDISGVE